VIGKQRPGEPGTVESRRTYDGRILNVDVDLVRFPDGSEAELEVVRHSGAAAVLPVYRAGEWGGGTGCGVILIRQYRYAAGGTIWEVPAGKLDPGETPEHCAKRELEEEAGVVAGEIHALTTIYTTPGFTDEKIHLFLALDLREGTAVHESLEFIERHEVSLDRALELVESGEIVDGKTVCTLLYAAAFVADRIR
jgi:ADP-ribose diphosphatase